jgi:hypothetical protein
MSLVVLVCASLASAQRITEALTYWTLGVNAPEVSSGTRGDGTTGSYHHLLVGTNAYYYEVLTPGAGTAEFWVYDPFKCQSATDPGYGSNGMAWGLQNPLYQALCVGDFRQDFIAGCLGYSPWSTVSPYSPCWYKDGLRGTNGVPWQAGWFKWTANGQIDNLTFTIYNVTYCITDGPPDDDITTGDCVQLYDATSFGAMWAALFGYGWKAFWLRGDGASGIEDPFVDVTGGDGAFAEFGAIGVAQPYQQTSWGNIKAQFAR